MLAAVETSSTPHIPRLENKATFTIRLPIGIVARAAEAPDVRQGARGRRVLLVDDDAATRDVVGQTLEYFGASVTTASSADEAIALVNGNGFDLVLTDLAMPGHDGFWLLQQIRKAKPRLPVAAITALSQTDGEIRETGFDHWLRKPVNNERLSQLLRM